MASTIVTKNSSTASAVPVSGDLTQGELAVNVTDKRLFTKNSGGTVVELGTNPSSITMSGGTANGVAYLNGSKVVTTGSALTFDGTTLKAAQGSSGATAASNGNTLVLENSAAVGMSLLSPDANASRIYFGTASNNRNAFIYSDYNAGAQTLIFGIGSGATAATEAMRLTSTGLGIGTSSPAYKLDVAGTARVQTSSGYNFYFQTSGTTARINYLNDAFSANISAAYRATDYSWQKGDGSEVLKLDSSGNLGLGVTPSASTIAQFEGGSNLLLVGRGNSYFSNNATFNSAFKYINTAAAGQYLISGSSHYWYTAPSGTAGNPITFTQAMTLAASGNLGVGATGVKKRLTVSDASSSSTTPGTNPVVWIGGGNVTANTLSEIGFTYGATSWSESNPPATVGFQLTSTAGFGKGDLTFCTRSVTTDTAPTERARIDSSGNFGVGTTSPSSGIQNNNSVAIRPTSGDSCFSHVSGTTSGTGYLYFGYNTSIIGSVTQSGTSAVLYNVTSDQRLKENIADADDASALIDGIQVRKYDWKSDGSHQRFGFIAQELVTVAPEAVHQPTDPDEMMAVDYSKLVPMLVKEIQSLRKRVAQLEGK